MTCAGDDHSAQEKTVPEKALTFFREARVDPADSTKAFVTVTNNGDKTLTKNDIVAHITEKLENWSGWNNPDALIKIRPSFMAVDVDGKPRLALFFLNPPEGTDKKIQAKANSSAIDQDPLFKLLNAQNSDISLETGEMQALFARHDIFVQRENATNLPGNKELNQTYSLVPDKNSLSGQKGLFLHVAPKPGLFRPVFTLALFEMAAQGSAEQPEERHSFKIIDEPMYPQGDTMIITIKGSTEGIAWLRKAVLQQSAKEAMQKAQEGLNQKNAVPLDTAATGKSGEHNTPFR